MKSTLFSAFVGASLLLHGCHDQSLIVYDVRSGPAHSAGSSTARSGGAVTHPPAPAANNVPKPSATVSKPNLRVIPWAGFTAAISYTYDDSQPSQVEHWPELQATGVPMTFFVNPSHANQQAGFDTSFSAMAAAGSEIGNHTWSHCHADLSGHSPIGTAEDEVDKTTTYIESHLGVSGVYSFAAPYGETGWNTYAAPRFLVGRGVVTGLVPPGGQSDWYNLPAFTVSQGQTKADFNAFIDSARSGGRWGIFLFHSILPTTNNWYAGVEIADITASVSYAVSFKDIWIDTMGNIGAYTRAQQMFEALTPSQNTWTWKLPAHFPPGKILRVKIDGGSLQQGGTTLAWDAHGYYEVALDSGSLSWSP